MTQNFSNAQSQPAIADQRPEKKPRIILSEKIGDRPHSLYSFPPNREILGGTSYLIVGNVNVLVDCPAWDDTTRRFLEEQGGVDWIFLTHRDSFGQVRELQQALNCKVLVQEQEAYLLPGMSVVTFEQEFEIDAMTRVIWTPGHSPGSSCLYYAGFGGVLFTGRHLLPNPQGALMPVKTAKTFHWPRQLNQVQRLMDKFSSETLEYVCPGANLGFLRGKYAIANAYHHLQHSLDTLQDNS